MSRKIVIVVNPFLVILVIQMCLQLVVLGAPPLGYDAVDSIYPLAEKDTFVIIANATEIESPDISAFDLTNGHGPVKYHGAQLWRIPFDTLNKRNAVTELQNRFDVSMWSTNGTVVDLFLKQSVISGARKLLSDSNVHFDVVIDDIQHNIEKENPPKEVIEQLQNRKARAFSNRPFMYNEPASVARKINLRFKGAYMGYNTLDPPMELWPDAKWGHRMTWSAYHRIGDIHGYLDYLANTYPDICSVQDIGKSTEGRSLKVLRISNGNTENDAIWIDGGIHAREWISPAAVTFIINQFTEEWEDQPTYIQNIDWYILPVANPDGYEYTHNVDRLWRKNRGGVGTGRCAGVDLNRNFGYKWGGKGASKQPCSEIFAGTGEFSEPETRAQKNFMENTAAKFAAFLTFHSYGQYILYPWGYDRVVPPDYKELNRVGVDAAMKMKNIAGLKYSVGPSGSLLYPASGASDDWAKGSLGIKYTYTIELRDSGRYGFILPAEHIENTSQEAMELVKVVASAIYEDEKRQN